MEERWGRSGRCVREWVETGHFSRCFFVRDKDISEKSALVLEANLDEINERTSLSSYKTNLDPPPTKIHRPARSVMHARRCSPRRDK